MTIQAELQPASFKNVPFLVTGTSTSGGRKTVTHEFVNSDKRNVEDLGLLQKTFNITAVIASPNYIAKRDNLVRALEEGGRGELIHPFFGKVNVVAKPYTVTENLDALGEATFSLVFERSELNANPQPSGASQATIDKLADTAQESVNTLISDTFKVSKEFVRNFKAAEIKLANVADSLLIASRFMTQNSVGIDSFANVVDSFSANARTLINSPSSLGPSIIGLYDSLRGLSDIPEDINKALNTLFDFGDDEPEIAPLNAERIERKSNNDLIDSSIKTLALVNSYREVVNIDFSTVDDIDNEQDRLDSLFSDVLDTLDIDSKNDLQEIRTETRAFLDEQRISAKRVITEETKSIPAQVLAFNLYGDVELTQDIIDLNNISDVSFIEGSIQVLS